MGEFEIEPRGSHMGCFLIMINVIFEKTYFVQEDFEVFSQWEKIKNSPEYVQQTIQYGWNNTFVNFKSWMEGQQQKSKSLLFLPVRLVLSSYLEKFDFMSLGYYLFFRIRYVVNNSLPYEKTLKGILISFSGIDGVGKSTQIKLLSNYLINCGKNQCWRIDVYVFLA